MTTSAAAARQAAKAAGGGTYKVKSGDSWFKIAGEVYGNQRMAGQLMAANGGGHMLHPGDVIKLPVVSQAEAANPHFSQQSWNQVLALNEQVRLAKEQEAKNNREAELAAMDIPNSHVGMETALRMLGEGSLTAAEFHQLFPHIDLANAIYASYPGNLNAGMVTELWTQGQHSQQTYVQQKQTSQQLDNDLQEFQAGLISRGELQHKYPHLSIDQALGLIGQPAALFNMWMTEVGRLEARELLEAAEQRELKEAQDEAYDTFRAGEVEEFAGQTQSNQPAFLPSPEEVLEFLNALPGINLPLNERPYTPVFSIPRLLELGKYTEVVGTPFGDLGKFDLERELNLECKVHYENRE